MALFIEVVPAAIAMFDTDMRYLAASQQHIADLALLFSTSVHAPAEVIGRTYYEVNPGYPQRWRTIHAHVLAGEELAHEEDPVQDTWVRWSMKPWCAADGRIAGAVLYSEMVTEQVLTRRAFAESEERLRATFDNAAVGIGHVSLDGRLTRFNETLCRISGWPADELITKTIQEVTYPDDLAIERHALDRLRSGKANSQSADKRILRKNGTIVWIRWTISCVRRQDESIDYYVTVIEDISDRKRAEEKVHLLMREADHRVRNLLGLVQAIARQTVGSSREDFVERFTERVQALAASQALLGKNRQGADLDDLVQMQLAHFADLVGSRITMHGPKLHLSPNAAQTIGLALHELSTNAGKYGALSTDVGRVDVGWLVDDDAFAMSWTERNGPPVQPPRGRGFGTTVVDAMARQALGGEVRLEYARSGLEWRMTCPAKNALEPTTEQS